MGRGREEESGERERGGFRQQEGEGKEKTIEQAVNVLYRIAGYFPGKKNPIDLIWHT